MMLHKCKVGVFLEKKELSRTDNSVKNIGYAVVGKVINLVVQFVLRTIFIKTLTVEYLGINGLFSNILSLLSLAELGVGASITYSLYRPIAKKDERQIAILMRLYKRAYIAIGCLVLVIGTFLTPLLPFFYKEIPDVNHLRIIYLLFVVNSGISYFYAYKSSFIIANQKNYIVTNNTYLMQFFCTAIQAVLLILFHNYIVYLMLQVVFTFLTNIRLSLIANKAFPVLKRRTEDKLDTKTKNTIISNIKALLYHRIGAIVVFSTDNILLSKLFGVAVVGLYSNYSLIVTSLEGLVNQVFIAITASIGNLGTEENLKHKEDVYNKILFLNFWIYSFCSVALAVLINPFIQLWVGANYLMPDACVVFIVVNFFIKGMRQTNMTFNQAFGLVPRYKYMPIPECVINLFASIIIAKYVGSAGIFIGTTVSTVLTSLWIETRVIYKYGFSSSPKPFVWKYILYWTITIIEYGICQLIVSHIFINGMIGLIIKALLVFIIGNLVIAGMTFYLPEFKYTLRLIKKYSPQKH